MSRAPFIVIDGKAYRWKDILDRRQAGIGNQACSKIRPPRALSGRHAASHHAAADAALA